MTRSRNLLHCLAAVAALAMAAQIAGAATITVSSATVQDPADPARLCVGLVLDAEELVAGTENELAWDGACATLLEETCAANPAHGKDLSGAIQAGEDFRYKALVLSFTDTDPIPAGDLYCCDFSVQVPAPGDCCPVSVEAPGSSDQEGNPLTTTAGAPGQVCLSSDASTPLPTSTGIATSTPSPTSGAQTPTVIATVPPVPTSTSGQPSSTGTPSSRTPTQPAAADSDDDACAVTESNSTAWLPWLPAMALLALRKRRVSK